MIEDFQDSLWQLRHDINDKTEAEKQVGWMDVWKSVKE